MTLIDDPALFLLTSAAAGAVGAAFGALPYRRKAARAQAEKVDLETQLGVAGQSLRNAADMAEQREREEDHLARVRLPSLIQSLWEGGGEEGAEPVGMQFSPFADSALGQAHESVLQQVRDLIDAASERSEAGARAAVRAVAQALQNLSQEQVEAVEKILERHHGSAVFADLIPVDHAAAQIGRKAEIILALVGDWPGVQRDNCPLLEAVRGGVSRIKDYTRVQIADAPPYNVTSGEVEPLVLIVAELLDNAARFSAPGTPVNVRFVDAHNGVTIEIDDAGIGMSPETLERARYVLTGRDQVRLTELDSSPPLGHLAVGTLAARYGIRVTVRDSPYGGVSAVVFVPRTLLTAPRAAELPDPASFRPMRDSRAETPAPVLPRRNAGAAPAEPAVPVTDRPAGAAHGYDIAPDGLPVRVRRSSGGHGPAAPAASRPPTDGALSAAAFVAGSRPPASQSTDDEENVL
ncbi:ATP-binding protein [Streptomyces sp. NBC_00838]|uniref:ATP-binding protein n=1 Tax=Streptomyces sp. NBC_00838 TaxID=2903680 RepID=UPI00386492B3|nr:ATP-binding protein [Streptomyces sp. NBC_00838]